MNNVNINNFEGFAELPKTLYSNPYFDGFVYPAEQRYINHEANINGLKSAAKLASHNKNRNATEAVALYTNARLRVREEVLVKHHSNSTFKGKVVNFLKDAGYSLKTRVCASLGGTIAALADSTRNVAGVVFNLVKAGVYLVGASYTLAGGVAQLALNLGLLAMTGRICIKVVRMEDLTRRLKGLGNAIKGSAICFGKAVGYALGSPFILVLGAVSPKNLVRALGATNVVDLDAANRAYVHQKNEADKKEIKKVKAANKAANFVRCAVLSERHIEQAERENIRNKMDDIIEFYPHSQFEEHFNAERANLQREWNTIYQTNNRKFIQTLALEHLNDLAVAPSRWPKFNVFGRRSRRPAPNSNVQSEQAGKDNVNTEPMSNVGISDYFYAASQSLPSRSPDVTLNTGERSKVRPSIRQRIGSAFGSISKKVRFPSSSIAPSAIEQESKASNTAPANSEVRLDISVSNTPAPGPHVAVTVTSASSASRPTQVPSDIPAPVSEFSSPNATATQILTSPQPSIFGRLRNRVRWQTARFMAARPSASITSTQERIRDGYGDYGISF